MPAIADIKAITIGHQSRVTDVDVVDRHIVRLNVNDIPAGGIGDGKILDRNVAAKFRAYRAGPDTRIVGGVVGVTAIAIDRAAAGNGHIRTTLGGD